MVQYRCSWWMGEPSSLVGSLLVAGLLIIVPEHLLSACYLLGMVLHAVELSRDRSSILDSGKLLQVQVAPQINPCLLLVRLTQDLQRGACLGGLSSPCSLACPLSSRYGFGLHSNASVAPLPHVYDRKPHL